jgi:DNA polymerase III alpha subunit
MIKCGVFDSFGITRQALMSVFEGILNSEHDKVRNNISGQLDLFSMSMISSNADVASVYEYPCIPEYELRELLSYEKENSDFFHSLRFESRNILFALLGAVYASSWSANKKYVKSYRTNDIGRNLGPFLICKINTSFM